MKKVARRSRTKPAVWWENPDFIGDPGIISFEEMLEMPDHRFYAVPLPQEPVFREQLRKARKSEPVQSLPAVIKDMGEWRRQRASEE